MTRRGPGARRCLLKAAAFAPLLPMAAGWPLPARAQPDHARNAVPFYRPPPAMQGLYRQWLLPRARAFAAAARALAPAIADDCAAPQPRRARAAWVATLQAWEGLATVPLGPLIERRSLRTLDFQPTRPEGIERAIARAAVAPEALLRVGAPAKGLPALEWLLWSMPAARRSGDPAACRYAAALATELAREAQDLAAAIGTAADAEWDEARGDTAFAELLNQFVGAVERLRWTNLERPRREAAARATRPPRHPRAASGETAASWRRQWDAIESLAVFAAGPAVAPPAPGAGLVPLETYLRGRGLNALADRWAARVGRAAAAIGGARPDAGATLDLAVRELAALKALAETEVAAAVEVSIGFSDADGD